MALLDGSWVTEGGLETDLLFNHGIDLPGFAAFPLVDDAEGTAVLRRYYADYAAIARTEGVGLLLETPTWRANADWGRELGYDAQALDRVNRLAVELIRAALAAADVPERRISGCIGPRGDGYVAARTVADAATEYHVTQIRTLADAIRAVDDGAPADFYGLNCAHPTHVLAALDGGSWQQRLTFFRPNASTLSHAELDVMEELDAGDVPVLVGSTRKVLAGLSAVAVLGGCCGTDSRHVAVLWRNGSS